MKQTLKEKYFKFHSVFYKETQRDYFILIVHVLFLYLGGMSSFTDPARPRDYYSGKNFHPLSYKRVPALKIGTSFLLVIENL